MKIDFYAPCSVSRWVGDNVEPFDGSVSTALDAIEKQLYIDFCEDGAEYIDDESIAKLGYEIYSACYNMTERDGKLYVRVSVFMKFPVLHKEIKLTDGRTMDIPYDDVRYFKKFIDICIRNINGQMSDGWGECFEQHPFTIDQKTYYASAGSIEFASWYGIAVGNDGKMMRPVVYDQKSKLFDHGWVGGHLMDLDFVISSMNSHALSYDVIIRNFDRFSMKEFEKELDDCTTGFLEEYHIDRVFVRKMIDWFIDFKKGSITGIDAKTERRLRNYQKLFK